MLVAYESCEQLSFLIEADGKGDTYMQQIKPNGKQIIAQATPQVVYCLSILWPLAQAPLPIRTKVRSL